MRNTTRKLARSVLGTFGMEPSDVTFAEKWLVVAACLPIIGAGLLFIFA